MVMINDFDLPNYDNGQDMLEEHELEGESKISFNILKECQKPLWPGCT